MKCKNVKVQNNGPAEVLQVTEGYFDNRLKENEVHIEVKDSGINFADILTRLGLYRDVPRKPFIPGMM